MITFNRSVRFCVGGHIFDSTLNKQKSYNASMDWLPETSCIYIQYTVYITIEMYRNVKLNFMSRLFSTTPPSPHTLCLIKPYPPKKIFVPRFSFGKKDHFRLSALCVVDRLVQVLHLLLLKTKTHTQQAHFSFWKEVIRALIKVFFLVCYTTAATPEINIAIRQSSSINQPWHE